MNFLKFPLHSGCKGTQSFQRLEASTIGSALLRLSLNAPGLMFRAPQIVGSRVAPGGTQALVNWCRNCTTTNAVAAMQNNPILFRHISALPCLPPKQMCLLMSCTHCTAYLDTVDARLPPNGRFFHKIGGFTLAFNQPQHPQNRRHPQMRFTSKCFPPNPPKTEAKPNRRRGLLAAGTVGQAAQLVRRESDPSDELE